MNAQRTDSTQPFMTTIGNRPAIVLDKLVSMAGISVQCRLADGTDVWVPLSEICRLFVEEATKQAKVQGGLRQ